MKGSVRGVSGDIGDISGLPGKGAVRVEIVPQGIVPQGKETLSKSFPTAHWSLTGILPYCSG